MMVALLLQIVKFFETTYYGHCKFVFFVVYVYMKLYLLKIDTDFLI